MRRKLEPAEIFHEILSNCWYMSEAQDHYCHHPGGGGLRWPRCCPQHRDERAYLGSATPRRWRRSSTTTPMEPMPEDDAEFAARDEQTMGRLRRQPPGLHPPVKFKGGGRAQQAGWRVVVRAR